MKLTFLGATHEVTGSCTLLEINGHYGLVDCGMEQGIDVFVNAELPVSPADIDFVLLTHAHIDHSGKIPLLYKLGCTAPVYATSVPSRASRAFSTEWRKASSEAEQDCAKILPAGVSSTVLVLRTSSWTPISCSSAAIFRLSVG